MTDTEPDASPTLVSDRTGRRAHQTSAATLANDTGLRQTLDRIWHLLSRGVADRKSAFHTPTIATTHATDRTPALRTVILRACTPRRNQLAFHTDRRSQKYEDLLIDPTLTIHVYDPKPRIQVRLTATGTLHHKDEVSEQVWHETSARSLQIYQQITPPGRPIPEPLTEDIRTNDQAPQAGYKNFCVILATIQTIEWLHLTSSGHRRARFQWQHNAWEGTWLAP
ncbi:MAG: pyridoxamine 5'-phosphate oxidase family protein [Pseudomonadota bacterium]